MLFGGYGTLGTEIAEFFVAQGYDVVRPQHTQIDIVNYTDVYNYLSDHKPNIVINAAGKTGVPNIDRCETHQEETMLTNVTGAVNVACASKLLGIYNINISSGCVYQ